MRKRLESTTNRPPAGRLLRSGLPPATQSPRNAANQRCWLGDDITARAPPWLANPCSASAERQAPSPHSAGVFLFSTVYRDPRHSSRTCSPNRRRRSRRASRHAQKSRHQLQRTLPLPWGKVAQLHRQPQSTDLSLLWLRRARQCLGLLMENAGLGFVEAVKDWPRCRHAGSRRQQPPKTRTRQGPKKEKQTTLTDVHGASHETLPAATQEVTPERSSTSKAEA